MGTQKAYTEDSVQVYDDRHFGGRSGEFIFHRDLAALAALLPRDGRVLDIPCGTGIYLTALSRRGYRMVGADASGFMLRTTKARTKNDPGIQCDVNRLPFDDGAFDAVISLRLFSHFQLPELRPMLMELGRVTRPGGSIIFDTFAWSPRHWPLFKRVLRSSYMYPVAPRDIEALVSECRLKVLDLRRLYLFSPLWQRRLPLVAVKGMAALERALPGSALLRTFWSCSRA